MRQLPYVLYVLYVKSAVSLKWQVGFENDMKITPIFTINFSSKMLIKQCFTSLEHTFLDYGLKYFNPLLIVLFRSKNDATIFYIITYYKEGEKEDVKLTDEKTNFLPPRQLANP